LQNATDIKILECAVMAQVEKNQYGYHFANRQLSASIALPGPINFQKPVLLAALIVLAKIINVTENFNQWC